jgi:hypothetical protein
MNPWAYPGAGKERAYDPKNFWHRHPYIEMLYENGIVLLFFGSLISFLSHPSYGSLVLTILSFVMANK